MGNCQAAEAATVLIQHPGGGNRVDRIYWSVSANEIMNINPGHYVAQVLVASPAANGAPPVKQLKLLRPDDTLVIGQVYRLISFEDVLKEFAAKKCVKLGRLLKERGGFNLQETRKNHTSNSQSASVETEEEEEEEQHEAIRFSSESSSNRGGRHHQGGGGGQWKPALQSISELGT